MAFLDPVLNPVLQPLLNSSPFLVILLLALVVSLLMTLAYKFFTDQTKMRSLKEEQKAYQKQIKELRSQPEKAMQLQKEAMRKNMDYMKMSFKPMLLTMIPIFLFFGWMGDHLAYEPIFPGESYSITATFAKGVSGNAELLAGEGTELLSEAVQPISADRTVTWRLKSTEGPQKLTVKKDEQEWVKNVLITTALQYEEAVSVFQRADLEKVQIDYHALRPLGSLSLLGWKPTWLGWYVIFSLVFSMGLRKVLKVY